MTEGKSVYEDAASEFDDYAAESVEPSPSIAPTGAPLPPASPYGRVGGKLVERRYAAIPIIPASKRPGEFRRGEWIGMSDWTTRFAGRLPGKYEIDTWSKSGAGVGVIFGPDSQDLVGVDIDTDDSAIKYALLAVLPPTTIKKRGAKGETWLYRGPGVESKHFNDSNKQRLVDLLGPGTQSVLPPTLHMDTGEPYRWTGPDALDDVDPADLPLLPHNAAELIGKALEPFGYSQEPARASLASINHDPGEETECRQLNNQALANLDSWVPQLGLYRCRRTHQGYEAVATWRPSSTGQAPEKRKLNLKISGHGIRDFGADNGYTPINLVCAAQGLGEDWPTAFAWLSERLGMGKGVTIALKPSVSRSAPEPASEPGTATTPAGAVPADATEPDEQPKDGLDHLTYVPGLVGELIDWITATARRPNRVLALGAAVTVIGTLIGRRVAGPTDSATHLYVVALAPTGAGKQHPLDCAALLLHAAKAGQHVGPSEFTSMPAVVNFLLSKPLSLCIMDEFGAFLKRINSRKASGWEQAVSKMFRQIWGVSFGPIQTAEWAGRATSTIYSPAMSIFGASTADEFYESLQGSDLSNGFLNRFLVLSTDVRATETNPTLPKRVPDHLGASLQALYFWRGDMMTRGTHSDSDIAIVPDQRPWASNAAEATYYAFQKEIEHRIDRDPSAAHFMARCAEIGVRLATIRAVGRWGYDATVDRDDMEWGIALARASGDKLAVDARGNMVVDLSAGQFQGKILEIIKKRRRVQRRELFRSLQKSIRSARDFDSIINVLVQGGTITIDRVPAPKGGHEVVWYVWAPDQ